MSKPKYLKVLAVVEEDYKPFVGQIEVDSEGNWHCENVMSIKLDDDFSLSGKEGDNQELIEYFYKFLDGVINLAKERTNE